MSKPPITVADHEEKPINLTTYVLGYVLSLAFTITAYLLVVHKVLTTNWLIADITILALGQFIVQMMCFLHLGVERRPRWKLVVFGLMVSIVLILVLGSIWIMNNLNYHMPSDIKTYLHQNEGL